MFLQIASYKEYMCHIDNRYKDIAFMFVVGLAYGLGLYKFVYCKPRFVWGEGTTVFIFLRFLDRQIYLFNAEFLISLKDMDREFTLSFMAPGRQQLAITMQSLRMCALCAVFVFSEGALNHR